VGRIVFAISTEVMAPQEISTRQQHKYRLDLRKNSLTVRVERGRECVFKAGYEIYIITNFKNRRNSFWSELRSLEAEGCIK
jgi:hypothetical protein